jgi:hypothetical protein
MTLEQYKEEIHSIINEINDICATAIILDKWSKDEVIDYFHKTIAKIEDAAKYPEE